MDTHSTQEPAAPSRPWVPLLLIFATMLVAGLLCSDALTRLAPDPRDADTDIQPGIALVVDSIPMSGETARDSLVVDAPVDWTAVAEPPVEAVADPVAEVAALERPSAAVAAGPAAGAQSNGNTNPNANPNGHTNNGHTNNAHNGKGPSGDKP